MKILKWLLIVAAVLAALVVALLAYMGMLSPLKAYESKMGPYTIAYESITGPYSQTGPVFGRVFKALKVEGIEAKRGLGIYYDDPKVTPADKLRSDCGVVIEDSQMAKFKSVSKKFKVKKIAQKNCVVVEFPIKNIFSYMLGPIKGYPALAQYAKEKTLKTGMVFELYDEPAKKAYYSMEIVK